MIIPTSADELSSSVISIEWTKLGPREIIERPKKVDSVNCKELKGTLIEDSDVNVKVWRET
jgi:hypothetical protein